MQVGEKLFCHWDLVRFVTEEMLKQEDGTFLTLSVADENRLEYMIFLGKADFNSGYNYEVKVYKSEPNDKYVPHKYDNVKKFEENNEYASFFFDDFFDAREFTVFLLYRHPEYCERPLKEF